MKRLALLLAAVAALVLFTACPNKPEDDVLFYQENISLYLPGFETPNYQIKDTTIYYTQEFQKVGNDIIYDPCSEANANGYIDFSTYCDNKTMPMVYIENDTIYYNAYCSHWRIANCFGQKAKIEWHGKDFTFSLVFDNGCTSIHNCHRVKNLSD